MSDYLKKITTDDNVKEILLVVLKKILLKQDNLDDFFKINHNKIIHIRDWISSIVENNEQWKNPRVLTIEALNNAANKYFEKKINKIQTIELDKTHEKLIINLGDYYVVQMLTPEALDNESKVMQHCIGEGGYDQNLKDSGYKYLSLRDKYNKAHVTLEIYKNEIFQLQGKQNKLPDKKYLEILLPWLIKKEYKNIPWHLIEKFYDNDKWIEIGDIVLEESIDYLKHEEEKFEIIVFLNEKAKVYFAFNFRFNQDKLYLFTDKNKNVINHIFLKNNSFDYSKIIQSVYDYGCKEVDIEDFNCILNKHDNKIYSIFKLPENCISNSGINLSYFKDIIDLPDNLTVNGDFRLYQSGITKLPKGLTVKGNLTLSHTNIEKLSDDLRVEGNLDLSHTLIRELPENLSLNGHLDLSDCSLLERMPQNLIIGKNLYLKRCPMLKRLPNRMFIGKNLYFRDLDLDFVSKKIVVKKDFTISRTCIRSLPRILKVENCFSFRDSSSFKANFKINKSFHIIKCKGISMNEKDLYLINEEIDFENIWSNFKIYSKQEFLDNMKKQYFFSFD